MSYTLNRETFGEVRTADVYFSGYGTEEAPWGLCVGFAEITDIHVRRHEWGSGRVLTVYAGEISFTCNLDGGYDADAFVIALQEASGVEV